MKNIIGVFVLILICYSIGVATGYNIKERKSIEDTIVIYNEGEPLTEYKHTIREVIYDIDINDDGKYDATVRWVKDNK